MPQLASGFYNGNVNHFFPQLYLSLIDKKNLKCKQYI